MCSKGGAISTTVGTEPFYTISDNPQTCNNMKAGDSCTFTWTINATGPVNYAYDFYSIAEPINYTEISIVNSDIIRISIVQDQQPPEIINVTITDENNETINNSNPALFGQNITFSAIVDVYNMDHFNNSLKIENLTFSGKQNITRYLELPREASIIFAYINLSGYDIQGMYADDFIDASLQGNDLPSGVTNNETYIWVVDGIANVVDRYYINGSYDQEAFSLSGVSNPRGITFNGSSFWVTGFNDNNVHKFDLSGTEVGTFSIAGIIDNAYGITNNGTFFWIMDYTNSKVHKFWMNGSYANNTNYYNFDTISKYGLTIKNNEYIWITGITSFDKYYMNGSYTGISFSTRSGNGVAITENGTYFWISDSGTDKIDKYYEISNYPTNPWLEVGAEDGNYEWKHSGAFNLENNRTTDLASEINNYLTNCKLQPNGNCTVPFKFHSDTAGKLQYSDIGVTYKYPNDLNSVWLKIWDGTYEISNIIWQGFLELINNIWIVTVNVNETFHSITNYTIYANDTSNNTAIYQGNFSVIANEAEGRVAIENGINSTLTNYIIFTDQQIYIRYQNNTQKLGKFDKVVRENNQTWAINYVTSGESFTNIGSLGTTVNILEISDMTSQSITSEVEAFISQTKW